MNLFKEFSKEICSNCKNKKECQEELRKRLDDTIKCYEYERKKKNEI